MSLRRPSKNQPENFEFNSSSLEAAKSIVAKYPEGKQQSAVMALLYIAQRQNNNWIPLAAMKYIAKFLDMPYIKVYEVATFYSMFNLEPVGKYFIQICTTTPCWLRGSDKIVEACERNLKIKSGKTTSDGMFTIKQVECLGACVNAPMMQINDDYYEDLTEKTLITILENFKNGKKNSIGPQLLNRVCSEPHNKKEIMSDNNDSRKR